MLKQMRDFKKYEIWQLSHAFTLRIYSSTSLFPKDEIYGITSQIRRASSSIPTNISEGCGRNSDKEFNQYLNIALGSASETEYLIILSRDLNYIDTETFEILEKEINTIKSKIYKLKQILIQQ
ncbi:TIGR02436, four helix bundle protein [Flavobacteriaceae bacterium]